VAKSLQAMAIGRGNFAVTAVMPAINFIRRNDMDLNQVKMVKINELKPHPKNPRIHPDSAMSKLIKSINQFGFTNPILADKNGIILAGHARCKAAQKSGINEVPVIFLDLEGADADAYLITDNKVQEETKWAKDSLADLIKELKDLDYDTSFTGFDAPEIEELFNDVYSRDVKEDEFDVEAELEKNEEPISRQGDLWFLGSHRLYCGDATKPGDVEKLMDGKKANLVVTDLPYNVDYQGVAGKIKNDNMEDKEFYEFLFASFKNMYNTMADGAPIYVFHADRETVNFRTAFKNAGFFYHQTCIWVKNVAVISRADFMYSHEPIIYGWKPTSTHKFYGGRKNKTTWFYDKPSKNTYHPTTKPTSLISYPIRNSSLENSIVLDLFGGSGSTLCASEQLNRICYIMELEEKFADVITKRYIQITGSNEGVFLIRDGEKIKYSDIEKTL
jgi:DNA modification methylase